MDVAMLPCFVAASKGRWEHTGRICCDAESCLETLLQVSGAPARPLRQTQRCSRAFCARMAAFEECSADAEQGSSSVAQRAEELFNNLAHENLSAQNLLV